MPSALTVTSVPAGVPAAQRIAQSCCCTSFMSVAPPLVQDHLKVSEKETVKAAIIKKRQLAEFRSFFYA